MKRLLKLAAVLALAGWPAAPSSAQAPDRRGEVATGSATYRGVRASAPIPPALHLRNEGGSDGAGLCVPTSVTINGSYQGVPGLDRGKDSRLWRLAKARPGGYGPEKLAALVDEVYGGEEKYASYLDTDPAILDRLSRQGYPIGATMNTGQLYGYRPINHMISLVHYRTGGLACVVDNNDPGKYHWMPASEYARRWIDGGIGWAWIWLKKRGSAALAILLASAALVALAVACIVSAPPKVVEP